MNTINGCLKLLLVEDNLLNQKLMGLTLKKHNYLISYANNGLEGFEKFKSEDFDIILMDLMMPVMDGFEAASNIRKYENEHPERKRTPIIAFTADTINNDEEKCRDHGMDYLIEKPFDVIRFEQILEEL